MLRLQILNDIHRSTNRENTDHAAAQATVVTKADRLETCAFHQQS